MAEGRRDIELSWSLPEMGPTTGTMGASHTLARVEGNLVLEREGQGNCPLSWPRCRVWLHKGKSPNKFKWLSANESYTSLLTKTPIKVHWDLLAMKRLL